MSVSKKAFNNFLKRLIIVDIFKIIEYYNLITGTRPAPLPIMDYINFHHCMPFHP